MTKVVNLCGENSCFTNWAVRPTVDRTLHWDLPSTFVCRFFFRFFLISRLNRTSGKSINRCAYFRAGNLLEAKQNNRKHFMTSRRQVVAVGERRRHCIAVYGGNAEKRLGSGGRSGASNFLSSGQRDAPPPSSHVAPPKRICRRRRVPTNCLFCRPLTIVAEPEEASTDTEAPPSPF